MQKYILGLGVAVLFFASCNSTTKKEENKKGSVAVIAPDSQEETNNLSDVITRFVRAYSSKDNAKANKLIHPDLGFTVIYRPGASDDFLYVDSVDFSKPLPEYYAYEDFSHDFSLTYEKLPKFDCGTEKWNKQGFFCDTTSHPNQISNIIAFNKEFEAENYSEADLEKAEKSEAESYRVIVTGVTPLIFHVQLYQGKWYVTTLDRAYAGCDA